MSARNLFSAAGFYMAANLAAGLLNYLFQIMASRQLNAMDFSAMSSWIAHVSVFFVLGGVLQYSSNFLPASGRVFRLSLLGINIGFLGLIALWFTLEPGLSLIKAAIMLVGATLFGWTLGQIQGRLLFFTVATANLVIGATKNLIALLPLPLGDVEKFAFAFFACNLPALWLLTDAGLRRSRDPVRHAVHSNKQGLMAAGLLSTYATLIPQIDLVLLDWTQSREVFTTIARASVFYKAIYFCFFAIAQFLLPLQLKSTSRSLGSWPGTIKLGAASVTVCAIISLIAPWIAREFLRWDSEPGPILIFLSCLNMILLTWIFMLAQESCACKRVQTAILGLVLLATEWALQWLLALPAPFYFALAALSQFTLLLILYRSLGQVQTRRSLSTDSI
jgi:hypothetical protein